MRRVAVFDPAEMTRGVLPLLHHQLSKCRRRPAPAGADDLERILRILDAFTITRTEIRKPRGNRMAATRRFADHALMEGFEEEVRIEADLHAKLRSGKGAGAPEIDRILLADYIHNRMAGFWRRRAAFDHE